MGRHDSMATECVIFYANSFVMGHNDGKTSPKYRIEYENDEPGFHGHAEMRAVSKIPKSWDPSRLKVYVKRYRKDGSIGMARPCLNCQSHLWMKGILARNVWFTDDEGQMQKFTMQSS